MIFVEMKPEVLKRYGRSLISSAHWLQRRTKYDDISAEVLGLALESIEEALAAGVEAAVSLSGGAALSERLVDFLVDVREEYFSELAHLLDSRYYSTHRPSAHVEGARNGGAANGAGARERGASSASSERGASSASKYSAKRRGYVVSMGEDIGAIKISGWTHTIPEYFDFDRFWAGYPGASGEASGGAADATPGGRPGVPLIVKGRSIHTTALHAHVWGMHHRYPTNSPAIDAEGRGNPAGAHPFKAYNVLLMHNGEQVGVDSTSPFLNEFGFVHADPSMGEGAEHYHGDSIYERKALTDTEYAAYLVDFTR